MGETVSLLFQFKAEKNIQVFHCFLEFLDRIMLFISFTCFSTELFVFSYQHIDNYPE